jgi:hypothetical protein
MLDDTSSPAADSSCVVAAEAVWAAVSTAVPMPAKSVAVIAIIFGETSTNDIDDSFVERRLRVGQPFV